MSNAPYAAAYRARQSAKLARRGEALKAIVEKLEGNKNPLAATLRTIATDALADPKPEQPK